MAKPKRKAAWKAGKGKVIADELATNRANDAKQKRQLGTAVHNASADKLFSIDTGANASAATDGPVGKSGKRAQKRNASLRNEAILVPNSNVAAIGAPLPTLSFQDQQNRTQKRRAVSNKETQKLLGRINKKQSRGGVPKQAARKSKVKANPKGNFDLWGAAPADLEPANVKNTAVLNQPNKRQKRRKGALRTVAHSVNPAVEVADPGASYNPDHEQHQDLIGEALAEEYENRREERRLKPINVERMALQYSMLPNSKLVDPSDMLPDESALEIEDAAEADHNTGVKAAKAVKRERLTQAKRNKRERAKVKAREAKNAKAKAEVDKQLGQLGQISKEVDSQLSEEDIRAKRNEVHARSLLSSSLLLLSALFCSLLLCSLISALCSLLA